MAAETAEHATRRVYAFESEHGGLDTSEVTIDPTGDRITQTVDVGHRIVAITYGHSLLWVGVA